MSRSAQEVRDEQEVFILGLEDLEREHARVVGVEPRSLTEVLRSFRRADDLPLGRPRLVMLLALLAWVDR